MSSLSTSAKDTSQGPWPPLRPLSPDASPALRDTPLSPHYSLAYFIEGIIGLAQPASTVLELWESIKHW